MLGIILWYNAEKSVGLVWCEDQGPLAYVGPQVERSDNLSSLARGTQICFDYDEVDGCRTVRRIEGVAAVMAATDPAQILASYANDGQPPALSVVA